MNAQTQDARSERYKSKDWLAGQLRQHRIFHSENQSRTRAGRFAFIFLIVLVVIALAAPLSLAQFPERGQIWKEYNISAYTQGVTNTSRPEQAIMDAILRQTGHNVWCGATPGLLQVNQHVVRVYHTPEIQEQVAAIVNQYLLSGNRTITWQFRVMTVNSPAWRAQTASFLRAAETQSPGSSAWILNASDVPNLVRILQERYGLQQVNSPIATVHNGQPITVNLTHPRQYVRGVYPDPNGGGFRTATGLVESGCKLEFTPLVTGDDRIVDALVQVHIDNLERVYDVNFPSPSGRSGSFKIQTPRIDQFRFQERFMWAADRALLISVGITPSPIPERNNVPGLSALGGDRVETLILIVRQQ